MVKVLDELLVTYMSENKENTTGSSSFHSTGAAAAMTTQQPAVTGRSDARRCSCRGRRRGT